jgi:hypothetical protein
VVVVLQERHVRRSTVALLAVLGCALVAAWFFSTHERVVRLEHTGYRGESRVNEFLAAEMLLAEFGIEADSLSSLTPSDWLPEATDTIVARLAPSFAIGEEGALLRQWVDSGGHLILLPPRDASRVTDAFLDDYGLRIVEVDVAEDEERDADGDGGDDADDETYEYLVDLDNTRYRLEFDAADVQNVTLGDDKGAVALRRVAGEGYITVIANALYFSNAYIGMSDHARLMLDAVAGYIDPGGVWFVYDAAFPSLLQLIWDNAPYIVISLAVLLGVWLWSVMPMFGPVIRQEPSARRSIIEHVRAAGHFAWRNDGAGLLARSSAAALIHEAEARHPGIARLSPQKQAVQIAKLTGLSAQSALDVISQPDRARHQREFTHDMQTLHRMRKEL